MTVMPALLPAPEQATDEPGDASSGRRRRWPLLVLVLLGLLMGSIGSWDVMFAKDFMSRVFGATLLLSGTISLVAAGIGFSDLPWRAWPGLVASGIAALLSLVFAVMFVKGHGPLGFSVIALVASVAAGVALGTESRSEDLKRTISKPTAALTSFLTLGALVGLVQFLYRDVYVPSRALPTAVLDIKLTKEHGDGLLRALSANVELDGMNGSSVRVLDSAYSLTGIKVDRNNQSPRDFRRATVRAYTDPEGLVYSRRARVGRYARESREVLLQSGKLLSESFVLEPDERVSSHFIVHVPRSGYDVVRLRATVIVARTDKLTLSDKIKYPDQRRAVRDTAGGLTVFATRKIKETSLVRSLTRDERVFVSALTVRPPKALGGRQGGNFPRLTGYVDRFDRIDGAPSGDPRHINRLSAFYSVTTAESVYDLQL